MAPKIDASDVRWWFWFVTLLAIVATLAGWPGGVWVVVGISALQILYFAWREQGAMTLALQVRIVYCAFTLLGLVEALRLPIYAVLLVGTFMVAFFDRCFIAVVLKQMPWNEDGAAHSA